MRATNKNVRSFFTYLDNFGHPIGVNFNKDGDTSNTVLGGCFSFIISIFLIVFLVFKGQRMINHNEDAYDTYYESITKADLADLGTLDLFNLYPICAKCNRSMSDKYTIVSPIDGLPDMKGVWSNLSTSQEVEMEIVS